MNVETVTTTVPEQVRSLPAARPRAGLRLTARERGRLLVFVDLILINGALLAAATFWNEFSPSLGVVLASYKWFVTLSAVWLVVGTVLDVYDLARSSSTTSIMASAGSAALVSALLYLAIPWLTPPILHRIYALGFVLLAASTVVAWRVLYAQALVQPAFRRRALVLGSVESAGELARTLQEGGRPGDANPFRGTGYHVVGLVSPQVEATPEEAGAPESRVSYLGDVGQLVRLARQHGVDEIVVASADRQGLCQEACEVLLDCRELGLQVSSLAAVYERLTGRLPVEHAWRDVNLILDPADSPASRLYVAFKRLLDVVLALLGLAIMGQLMPLIALGNAIWSRGPLFYRQQRVGKGGRPFVVLKFRTMTPDAEKGTGAVWCASNDSRITPIGRLLRKTHLDEMPQFINVLRGEMSMVGPRPERPHFAGSLARDLPLYRARHAVRPGITGWAQVHYRYAGSTEDSRINLEYDLYYLKHAGFYLDLLVLLQTARVVLGVG